MPPVLDPVRSKVDGLAFLGLSLARKSDQGHPDSQTHQTAFDLNEVLDRDYKHIFSTNDDGWLVGGGEPSQSYKLTAKDSAHVEIMRIGTYDSKWGGVAQEEIVNVIRSGKILIPQMIVVPTAVVANGDKPPELEIRFDMVDSSDADNLPVNWQLRFVHNQLFKHFQFPSRFCPGAFHSTIVRKAEFRSKAEEKAYFDKCAKVVEKWRQAGPQPLIAQDRSGIEKVHYKPKGSSSYSFGNCGILETLVETVDDYLTPVPADEATSGIYLFRDRNTITHYFAPNFRPDTPEKVKLVHDIIAESWDEQSLSWKASGVTCQSASRNATTSVKEASLQQDKPDQSSGAKSRHERRFGKGSKLSPVSFTRQGRHRTKTPKQLPVETLKPLLAKAPNQHAPKQQAPKQPAPKQPAPKQQTAKTTAKALKQETAETLTPETTKTTKQEQMAKTTKQITAKNLGYEWFRILRTPRGIVEEVPVTAE